MTDVAAAREDGTVKPPPGAQLSAISSAEAPAQVAAGAGSLVSSYDAALPQVLKILGSVVAPSTLLTALMYYFGREEYAGFFWYLGTDVTVFDLTAQDYWNNSVAGFIPPLIVAAGVALLALWAHQLVLGALPTRTRLIVLRTVIPISSIAGLFLVCLAMTDLFVTPMFTASFPEGRGLSLSVGVLLLAYAVQLIRLVIAERQPKQVLRRAPGAMAIVEWAAVFILVSVGLFWAVGSYAINVGVRYAQQIETSLSSRPDVVTYSEKRLILQGPGVREVDCHDPDAAYRFRYDGLKLMLQAGNQYFLLPAGWTRTNGTAIVIPRGDKIRLQFSPPGQIRDATC
jgi:hypothetical protein